MNSEVCNIIACGETGALWDGQGYSIGVNDCWKFGHRTNALVVVNAFQDPKNPTKYQDRFNIIAASDPDEFYSSVKSWKNLQPNYIDLALHKYINGPIKPGRVYHSNTSPIIAISLAANKGYKNIILYGVDFTNHPAVREYTLIREVEIYLNFIAELKKQGVTVYLKSDHGAFKGKLPVWGQTINPQNQ